MNTRKTYTIATIVGVAVLAAPTASAATMPEPGTGDQTKHFVAVYDGQPLSELSSIGFDTEQVPSRMSKGIKVADIKSAGNDSQALGTDCGWFKPCGVVHNETKVDFKLKRDANSHWSCGGKSPYAILWPEGSSSEIWKDTDCFTTTVGKIFYAPAGGWVSAGSYIRIWSHVWVYDFSW